MKALWFVNALEGQARELFWDNVNEHTMFDEMVDLMRVKYKSKVQQLRAHAEMDP